MTFRLSSVKQETTQRSFGRQRLPRICCGIIYLKCSCSRVPCRLSLSLRKNLICGRHLVAVVMTTIYDLIIFPLGKNSVLYILFSLYMIFGSFKESSSYFCDLNLAIHFIFLMKLVNEAKTSNPINTWAV